jgi:two-component system, NtrC family, sensor histidine kinase PilS
MGRTERILRWLYTGRLVLATAIFVAALARWLAPAPSQLDTLIATVALLSALAVTAAGLWWVELAGRQPGRAFLSGQVFYDVLLVTAVIFVTGGADSPYPPLYILVITAGALLLPLSGGMLVGALSCALYIGGMVLLPLDSPGRDDYLRAGLFAVMAVVTAALADRLRHTGAALGAAELELKQLRLDTDDILDAMATAVITVDGAGRLLYMNAAAAELLGPVSDTAPGAPVLERLDEAAPGLGTLIRRTSATRIPVPRFELRGRMNGEDRYLGVRTTLLERQGMPSVTAVFQDITEGRRLEQLARRADRLKAVAELGASLAHEIKNPLASIRSAVEQLGGSRLRQEDSDMLRRLVLRESDRLSRLLAEFMEFSRVELRDRGAVDLCVVTQGAVDLVSRHPDRPEGARIELVKPTTSLLVNGDEDLLHRAIFNLVLNAVQHTAGGGAVTVTLDWPEDGLPATVQYAAPIRITIRDRGQGVREEDIPRMFDPFFTRREGGTGLGLAMVHRAVEAHGGTITVSNNAHGGACFTLYLPAAAGEFAHAVTA